MDVAELLDRFPLGILNVSSLRSTFLITVSVQTILMRTDEGEAEVFHCSRL